MGRYFLRALVMATVAACFATAAESRAADCGESAQRQDLFYNYYVAPGGGGVPAQLYLCPRPTPPLVGHTWITYQPLMPHEFLYHHKRKYEFYHGDGSVTRTKIRYH
jgi:hypothetical protein